MRAVTRIINDLRENWGDWMLAIAVIGALLSALFPAMSANTVLRAVFILLTIIAVDRIVERRKVFASIRLQLDGLIAKNSVLVPSEKIETRGLRAYLLGDDTNVKSLRCAGLTLYGLFMKSEGLFKECLDRGMRLEFLISNPQTTWVDRFFDGKATYTRAREETVRAVERLQRYVSERKCSGSVALRMTKRPLFHSIVAFDPEEASGAMQVLLHMYEVDRDRLPMLLIRHGEHRSVYEPFLAELNSLWQHSEEHNRPLAQPAAH